MAVELLRVPGVPGTELLAKPSGHSTLKIHYLLKYSHSHVRVRG